jgi:propanol-preferring alcohol dehydrogenase
LQDGGFQGKEGDMRAMVLEQPGPIDTRPLRPCELSDPVPGPGQVRLRVRACGVCRTDLHQVEGELPLTAGRRVPGHQIVGVIDALGEGAGAALGLGARVGVPWLNSTCGACPACVAGRENLCAAARFTGHDVDGGYAEHALVPEAFALPLPPDVADLAAAPLLCAGVIGYRALSRSELRPGATLGLYGFGASAHLCLQIARDRGCGVFVFTRTPEHAALARELGAAWTGEAREMPPAPLDAAILFAPAGELVPEALRALGRGGTAVLAGIHMSAIPQLDYARHLYQEKTLRSVTAATREDARELLALAARIPLRSAVEVFPLAEANQALQRLKRSEIRGAAVLTVT